MNGLTFITKWLMGCVSGTMLALLVTHGFGLTGWAAFAVGFVCSLCGGVALVTFARPE